MTNHYKDIYIGLCSHACIYTSTSINTSDTFTNVIMRQSPWGAIIRMCQEFRFINCLFESLTVGGVEIYKEVRNIDFIASYAENVPSEASGYMFKINYEGAALGHGNITINGGVYIGDSVNAYGTFLDVDDTSSVKNVVVLGTSYKWFTNGVKATVNTGSNSIHLLGNTCSGTTNPTVDTDGKVNETGSGALVRQTSPSLVTPELGVATATSVNFGDNALNYYKEGTWIPDLQFGDAKIGIAYTTQAGEYIKIGKKVSLTGYIKLSSKGSSEGKAEIKGLPFTLKDSDGAYSAVTLWLEGVTFANVPIAYMYKNTSEIILEEIIENGTVTKLADTDFSDTSAIRFSVTYFTD